MMSQDRIGLTGNYKKDRHTLKAIRCLLGNPTVGELVKFNEIEWTEEAMQDGDIHPCFKGEMR